jgi:Tol biopolymer transport system component
MSKFLTMLLLVFFAACNENHPTESTKRWVVKEKVFFSSGTDDHINIFMMDPDGKNVVQLTHYDVGEYRGARISSDGKKLLYYRFDENTLINGIFLKDLYGPDPRVPLDYGYGCDFTPDGQSVIYAKHISSPTGGNDAIFRFYLDDSAIVRITADDTQNWLPQVSPDGAKIVFGTWRQLNPADTIVFSRWDIMIMNIDGTQQEYLLPPQNGQWSDSPSFSHDGTLIVFSTNSRLRILNLADRSVRDIVSMQNSINTLYPCFNTTDDEVYFDAGGWHSSSLYVIDVDGRNLRRLTNNAYINRHAFVRKVNVYE